MTNSHQQSIADAGSETHPLMLEKGSYVLWESRFMRYIDGKKAYEKMLRESIDKERDSRLNNEFDKFTSVTGKSIESMYEHFSNLMNYMDRHEVLPKQISINTKFLNSLQPEWSKYVTMVRLMHNLHDVEYDHLYDFLKQNEVNVNASRAKQAAKAHDPFALVVKTYACPSHSHSSPAYYVTHPSSVSDFDDDTQSYAYQGDP
ncbi:hypothetical protein Tco_1110756 [Tanacetum coccineum]|uniref:Gag-Pol polyprotein n=1 Tax=Tanacetum coccineum TaxID=301880 RepID=A0ABQ5IM57_9ASTR